MYNSHGALHLYNQNVGDVMAEHQNKNTNYQECFKCNNLTDRCEEDDLRCSECYDDDKPDGPYCESCYDEHLKSHYGENRRSGDERRGFKEDVNLIGRWVIRSPIGIIGEGKDRRTTKDRRQNG